MWLAKKKSKIHPEQWVPHHNLTDIDLGALLADSFGPYKEAGDYIAALLIIQILIEDGQFYQCGDILIYGKVG